VTLIELNTLDRKTGTEVLQRCCGSTQWVSQMLEARPFASLDHLMQQSEEIWWRLSEADWKEAFRHHPQIGDLASLREKFAATASWAEGEQSGVRSASEEILQKLAEGNRLYAERFGYIFIVCATGKSAEEMLNLLNARLSNPPEIEIKLAAGEQAKITRLRLEKLLEPQTPNPEPRTLNPEYREE